MVIERKVNWATQKLNIEAKKGLEFVRIEASKENLDLLEKLEKNCYPEEGQAWGKERFDNLFKELENFYTLLEQSGAEAARKIFTPLKDQFGCYLIKNKGELIGMFFLVPRESRFNPGETVIYIAEMMIAPQYRQGLGGAIAGLAVKGLIQQLIEMTAFGNLSIETKVRASTSYSILNNESAQKLLQANGLLGGPVKTPTGNFAAVKAEMIKTDKGEMLKEENLNLTPAELKLIEANPSNFYNYYIWCRLQRQRAETQAETLPWQKAA